MTDYPSRFLYSIVRLSELLERDESIYQMKCNDLKSYLLSKTAAAAYRPTTKKCPKVKFNLSNVNTEPKLLVL